MLDGKTIGASAKMDIFSAALSVLELTTGAPLVPKHTGRDLALTLLSMSHGGCGRDATAILQAQLRELCLE